MALGKHCKQLDIGHFLVTAQMFEKTLRHLRQTYSYKNPEKGDRQVRARLQGVHVEGDDPSEHGRNTNNDFDHLLETLISDVRVRKQREITSKLLTEYAFTSLVGKTAGVKTIGLSYMTA